MQHNNAYFENHDKIDTVLTRMIDIVQVHKWPVMNGICTNFQLTNYAILRLNQFCSICVKFMHVKLPVFCFTQLPIELILNTCI